MKLFLEQHPFKGISTNLNAFVRKEYCFYKKKHFFNEENTLMTTVHGIKYIYLIGYSSKASTFLWALHKYDIISERGSDTDWFCCWFHGLGI